MNSVNFSIMIFSDSRRVELSQLPGQLGRSAVGFGQPPARPKENNYKRGGGGASVKLRRDTAHGETDTAAAV